MSLDKKCLYFTVVPKKNPFEMNSRELFELICSKAKKGQLYENCANIRNKLKYLVGAATCERWASRFLHDPKKIFLTVFTFERPSSAVLQYTGTCWSFEIFC